MYIKFRPQCAFFHIVALQENSELKKGNSIALQSCLEKQIVYSKQLIQTATFGNSEGFQVLNATFIVKTLTV